MAYNIFSLTKGDSAPVVLASGQRARIRFQSFPPRATVKVGIASNEVTTYMTVSSPYENGEDETEDRAIFDIPAAPGDTVFVRIDSAEPCEGILESVAVSVGAGSGGTPAPTPTSPPTFTTQPTISPSTGKTNSEFTAQPGVVSNGAISSRAWLLNGSAISTSLVAIPTAGGTLTYQEQAAGAGGTASSVVRTASVTVPAPSMALSSALTVVEGNSGTATFTWTLTLNRDGSVEPYPYTWQVAGNGSNPANAADFGGTFPSGSGTFAPGETTKTITVLVMGDTVAEPNETFVLSVNTTGLNTVTSTGTITNDDVASPTMSLSANTSVTEANVNVTTTITVARNGAFGDLNVALSYSGSATSGVDYSVAPTSAVVPSGADSITFDISLISDTNVEPNETIVIAASLVEYPAVSATRTVTILNDDSPTLVFSSNASTVPEGNSGTTVVTNTMTVGRKGVSGVLTIDLAYTGTATAGIDYIVAPSSVSIPANTSTVSFDITINSDLDVEADESIFITATLASYPAVTATRTITITNDDVAPTWTVMSTPSELGYNPPYTAEISSIGTYRHNYVPHTNKPTPSFTVFCGPGGDNAADGLTWATRVRSLKQAKVKCNSLGSGTSIVRILAAPGEYLYSNQDANGIPDSFAGQTCSRTRLIIEACDNTGAPLNNGAQIISVHNQALPAFVATTDPAVYVSTYTTELPAKTSWDKTKINAKGNPQALHNVPEIMNGNVSAIISAVNALNTKWGHGAFYIDYTNKKVYVRTWDGRAPDAALFFGRGNTAANDAVSRNYYISGIWGNIVTQWLRGVVTYGGAGMYATTYMPDNSPSIIVNGWGCKTLYSSLCGVAFDGNITSTLYQHVADDAYKDGYNYDQSTGLDPDGTSTMRFNEIDCSGDWNGWDSTSSDMSDNGSSCHFRSIGTRINCSYDSTLNRAINDINASKTWNIGLVASNCRQTGIQSAPYVSGYAPATGETTRMWLDGCKSINNAYVLGAYKGGTVSYRNMTTVTPADAATGTINTY